ncbi:UNVERIFIED_CONTAM: hypothetical protein HDU68_002763 [Siphonaria sp. JEL0065]|nr:hypothetical protein HDU68_002760 [Siphonaria sp. JEL0065]KAJ3027963.1 hypothetical protein HDU68_002763 [Siphonaria sp. JEL0065]
MNGDWFVYGNRPIAYVALFRRVAGFVRQYTNMTAMVWGPNIGVNYPFSGGGETPTPTSGPDFLILDTNNDGQINSLDNPYTPFYPGDDVVDWVALSLYFYPYPNCPNCAVPPTYFQDYLTGSGPNVESGLDPSLVTNMTTYQQIHDFYQMFSTPESHNKPMLLPETGSPFLPEYINRTDIAQSSEVDIKMAWWAQVLSTNTLSQYPNLIAAVNFEEAKIQGNELHDWKLTNTTELLESFLGLVSRFEGNMHQASEFVYGCDGSVALK